jgi:NAD(P)-dependent dehydrogenase (short-subunit alcohol dehydrogenase family)
MDRDHVLIVGGTRGLGRVIVDRFLARGCAVTVLSRKPPSDIGAVRHVAADLESLNDASAVVNETLGLGGALRYLVFCQRYRGEGDPWDGEIRVGLTATKLLVDGFTDHFVADGDRGIGIVGSVYANFVGSSQPVGYHVVKAGLNQLVRYYAWSLGHRGIRVNAIMPLTYAKPETRDYYRANERLMETYQQFVPLGRMGDAEDCAKVVDFLCSDGAAFVSGQSIFVDGGVSVVWPEEIARGNANA